jgi:hypothetical protein
MDWIRLVTDRRNLDQPASGDDPDANANTGTNTNPHGVPERHHGAGRIQGVDRRCQ